MFFHNFKYSFKTLLKNKMLIFWTFAFPILLGLLFNLAFSDIENKERLNVIDIAIVNNEIFQNDEAFKETFKSLSTGEDKIFDIEYTNIEHCKELLDKKEISGYLLLDETGTTIYVNSSGVNETALRFVVDEINSYKDMLKNITTNKINNELKSGNYEIDYKKIQLETIELINGNNIKLNDISNKNLSYTMIEYYTLIAMSCLYGGMLSMFITNYKLANMNSVGKRTAVSPINKGKMLLGSLLASYIIQLFGLFLLFMFTIFIMKVDYGTNLPLIVLLACIGTLSGLSLGVLVASIFKTNENAKLGILIGITMLGCFLSGMMGITMKYVVDKNIPIINRLNPAAMITDGLYSLYYYNTLDRYIFNIISLLIFTLIVMVIAYIGLRRQKYDSI